MLYPCDHTLGPTCTYPDTRQIKGCDNLRYAVDAEVLTRWLDLTQIHRVISRDWKLWHSGVASAWRRDGHDNNWLLLEFALSLPFAVGLKTEAVSRALAATMVAEVPQSAPHARAHLRL